jgi:hypothetical protein
VRDQELGDRPPLSFAAACAAKFLVALVGQLPIPSEPSELNGNGARGHWCQAGRLQALGIELFLERSGTHVLPVAQLEVRVLQTKRSRRTSAPDTLLVGIDPEAVTNAAARRARTPLRRYNRKTGTVMPTKKKPLPSDATANRQIVEPMQRLLHCGKTIWKLPIDLDQFNWKKLRKAEPDERVRELFPEEEQMFWKALREDYHPICEMYLISGRRRSDWVKLPKRKVDRTAGTVRVPSRKRKKKGEITVTLTERELQIICEEWEKAPDCKYVFTYEARQAAASQSSLTRQSVRTLTVQWLAKAGIRWIPPLGRGIREGSRSPIRGSG